MITALVSTLSGCALVPGTSGWDMRKESSVALPVAGQDSAQGEQVPANVTVTPITAQLIIDHVRNAESSFRSTAAGGRTAASKSTVPDFGLMHQDYELGPGDIINVIVWDHPEITIPAGSYRSAEQSGTLVADDGTIFFPFAGTIKVAGKTTRQVRDMLSQRMSKVIENVQLDVRIVAFRSKRVYVVGEVKQPGLQAINDIQMNMLEAINRAGGITEEADHGNVLLTRGGQTWRVDMQALYEDGDVSQNVPLQPGDIVNVPDRQLNKVFVL
ncbi:MAG TPA: polysaccharide biosynthesis/export family protein, partial [Thauera sp.]|nr:polysaccharide biosynthesis/export family protein [Thauera sp.]